MRRWKDLGVVQTIYEEEHDEISSNSLSLSPTLSSPSSPFQRIAKTWSLTGLETDVLIHVHDQCFQLHKDPLISRSGYMKRQLSESSEITLSPPLNITAETFSSVVDFCYGFHIVITPFNVVALRTAAELLEMTEENGDTDGNLRRKTETYFCHAVSVNREYAVIVLRSSLALLPEAEETAFLASRCIEALGFKGEVDGWVGDLKLLAAEEFQMIAHSMHWRFTCSHDILYRIVDLYLKENSSKITEEQKSQICNSVDCNKLSPHLLIHAVQNSRMPLRFLVRAMLVEQLNTRRSFLSAATASDEHRHHQYRRPHNNEAVTTLGVILQRDAALRQVAQLKASMEATSSRIQRLERDLMSTKKLLCESENRQTLKSGRSASFRFSSDNKIDRGEKGSASSVSFRFSDTEERGGVGGETYSEKSCNENKLRNEKSFGRRLINGLRGAFGTSSTSKPGSKNWNSTSRVNEHDGDADDGDIVVIQDDCLSHHHSRSLV